QGVRVDKALSGDECDEENAVGDGEQHAEEAGQEADDVELLHRELTEPVGDGHARDQGRPAEVGRDHRPAPAATFVHPRADVQRQEVGQERGGRQEAHLRRGRIEDEHGDERQRDQGDLVAEQRDRLSREESAEGRVLAEERREEPPHARVMRMSPLIEVAFSSTSGPSVVVSTPSTSKSEVVSPLSERASTWNLEPAAIPTRMSPEADFRSRPPSAIAPTTRSPDA